MENNKYINLLREIKSVSFSTVDEFGMPQARIGDVMLVEDNKIYFTTARGKSFWKQLNEKPFVVVTCLTKEWQMIRVNGKVEKVERGWMEKIISANPILGQVYPGKSSEILDPFCIYEGEGIFFDLSSVPVKTTPFSVGDSVSKFLRYTINEGCICCGSCKDECPSGCITEGKPYRINPYYCINCGLCKEKCPVDSISMKEVV